MSKWNLPAEIGGEGYYLQGIMKEGGDRHIDEDTGVITIYDIKGKVMHNRPTRAQGSPRKLPPAKMIGIS